ncbi:alpha/beta fold hydrolase [Streptomyces formicae]|uniref:Alpha/beta hydrolase n=1 Tax=Streptomyces formicae TaxID=1616117 RepID=A0ABY3WU02_9ACTN|nr:alpha/beta hydrolase [Streptomyces formicae]UNM14782.1 alpha/beta hydrolase [Streptomyces formicae]
MRPHQIFGTGPGLVLVAGGATTAQACWGPFSRDLAERFTVVLAEIPGGCTDSSGLDQVADQLAATVDQTGLQRFDLAAVSLGCALAVRVAVRHPHRVGALALVGGFSSSDSRVRLTIGLLRRLLDGPPDALADFALLVSFGADYLNRRRALMPQLAAALTAPPNSRDHFDLALAVDILPDLLRIQARTLVIGLAQDYLATPAHTRMIASAVPRARTTWLDSGHFVTIERPRELLERLLGFLLGQVHDAIPRHSTPELRNDR